MFLPHRGSNLSGAILRWAKSQGLDSEIPKQVTPFSGRRVDPRIPRPRGKPELSAALIRDLAGDRAGSRAAFRRAVLRSNGLRFSAVALRQIATLDLYSRALWTRPVVAFAASPLAPVLPRVVRRKLDRIHVTLLSSFEARHEDVLERSRRVSDPSDPAILVARAVALRYRGDLCLAERTATAALHEAQQRGTVSEAAHALNELAFTRTWQGHINDAKDALNELFEGFGSLASLLWIGWSWWHRGALATYDNKPADALNCFGRARECMSEENALGGALNCDIASLAACRLAGDNERFELIRLGLADHEAALDEVPTLRHSLLIEDAEHARAKSAGTAARELYAQVTEDPRARFVQSTLAYAGIAELDRAEDTDSGAWATAWKQANAAGLEFVMAHVLVTAALAGTIRDAEARRRIDSLGAHLAPPRRPVRRVLDYCLGPEPQLHALFMP